MHCITLRNRAQRACRFYALMALVAAFVVIMTSADVMAAGVYSLVGDPADLSIRNGTTMTYGGSTALLAGQNASGNDTVAVLVFLLPDLEGEIVSQAHLGFNLASGSWYPPTGQLNLYGLGFRSSSAVQLGDYFIGAYGTDTTDATPIQADFGITWTDGNQSSAYTAYGTDASGDLALRDYLNAQVAAGAQAGDAIFLRFNPDTFQTQATFWGIASSEHANPPVLTITAGDPSNNAAPTVNAGADHSITLPADATLDGQVSDDGMPMPPSTLTTTWSKVSGPGTVTFADAAATQTTASFSVSGVYVLQLEANDGELSTAETVEIIVYPAFGMPTFVDHFAPGWDDTQDDWQIAIWPQNGTEMAKDRCQTDGRGYLVETVLAGEPYRGGSMQSYDEFFYGRWVTRLKPSPVHGVLNSMFSKDWDDKTTSYPWDDGTHFEVDIELLTHTFGPNCGQVHVAIHQMGQNNVDVADIDLDFNPSDEFHLWGFDIYPDRVDWHVDGQIIHTWQAPDDYTIPMNYEMFFNAWTKDIWILGPPATDTEYCIDWVTFRPLGGMPGNLAPAADAGVDQSLDDTDNNGGELVTLDASRSADVDGTIVSYQWAEGATSLATGISPSVALGVGVHTIDLTITDDDGATGTDSVVITVNGSPDIPGDADGDGDVDLNDFVILKTTFGQNPLVDDRADFDDDGDVDLDDFVILKSNFGV